jgi:hypothetical protein
MFPIGIVSLDTPAPVHEHQKVFRMNCYGCDDQADGHHKKIEVLAFHLQRSSMLAR